MLKKKNNKLVAVQSFLLCVLSHNSQTTQKTTVDCFEKKNEEGKDEERNERNEREVSFKETNHHQQP